MCTAAFSCKMVLSWKWYLEDWDGAESEGRSARLWEGAETSIVAAPSTVVGSSLIWFWSDAELPTTNEQQQKKLWSDWWMPLHDMLAWGPSGCLLLYRPSPEKSWRTAVKGKPPHGKNFLQYQVSSPLKIHCSLPIRPRSPSPNLLATIKLFLSSP